jgi:hypothetical protein
MGRAQVAVNQGLSRRSPAEVVVVLLADGRPSAGEVGDGPLGVVVAAGAGAGWGVEQCDAADQTVADFEGLAPVAEAYVELVAYRVAEHDALKPVAAGQVAVADHEATSRSRNVSM